MTSSDQLTPFEIMSGELDSAFNIFDGMGVLLCAGDSTESNAMTIAWGGFGTLWQKKVATVYVVPERYTHHLLESHDYFTIMAFDSLDVLNYMGSNSGRDGDKAAACNLHTLYTDNGTPYYAEATWVIECKKMYDAELNPDNFTDNTPRQFYADRPHVRPHYIYIGEIVSAMKR